MTNASTQVARPALSSALMPLIGTASAFAALAGVGFIATVTMIATTMM